MQSSLFCESIGEALLEVVKAAGGPKRVGPELWPEFPPEQAAQKLRDCLNPDRREKLSPEQVVWLMRLGRQTGCHSAAIYMNRECGYADPVPVEPEDERAALQREFIEASKLMQKVAQRLEALEASPAVMRRVV